MPENTIVRTFPYVATSQFDVIISKLGTMAMAIISVFAGYGIIAISKIGTSEQAMTTDYKVGIIAISIMIVFMFFRLRNTSKQESIHNQTMSYICDNLKNEVLLDEYMLSKAIENGEVISRDGRKVTITRVDDMTLKLTAREPRVITSE